MKKYLNNEKGLTLVEILAVIIIGSIILLLISNVHLFGQKQYKNQSEKTGYLYDVTYAAKVITKEIRKAEKVVLKDNILTLTLNEANETIFELQNDAILKNTNPFVFGISKFVIIPAEDNERKLKLEIDSIEQVGKNESINTEIHLREGVILEIK